MTPPNRYKRTEDEHRAKMTAPKNDRLIMFLEWTVGHQGGREKGAAVLL